MFVTKLRPWRPQLWQQTATSMLCFGSVTPFVPQGQLPREELRRSPLPPRPPPGLIFLHVPCPPILLSCILHQVCTFPCLPVLHIYPNKVSCLSLPCLPVIHIYLNPTKMNPSPLQTPHINCVSLLLPKQFHHQ